VDSQWLQKLSDKSITKETLYKAVEADFGLLPELINGTRSPTASVRYGCGSVLLNLSAHYPEQLYGQMYAFVDLLNSKYRILKWTALGIIANLCRVDSERKFDLIFEKYFGLLNDEYMVTVANVVGNSRKIALAKPLLIPRITTELLKVDKLALTPHLTEECKRVIAESAVESFNEFFDKIPLIEQKRVVSFVRQQVNSPRKSLRKKANDFIKRWSN
jgi:hypothetical protein